MVKTTICHIIMGFFFFFFTLKHSLHETDKFHGSGHILHENNDFGK